MIQQTLDKLYQMKLGGIADSVREQLANPTAASQTAAKRALYEGTSGLTGLLASLRVDRPDVILGVVPSLSGGILARLTGLRLQAPYGLLFQDLMGPLSQGVRTAWHI